jgi:hypothetical protein
VTQTVMAEPANSKCTLVTMYVLFGSVRGFLEFAVFPSHVPSCSLSLPDCLKDCSIYMRHII